MLLYYNGSTILKSIQLALKEDLKSITIKKGFSAVESPVVSIVHPDYWEKMSKPERQKLFSQKNIVVKYSLWPKGKATQGIKDPFNLEPSYDQGIEDFVDMYELRQCQGKLYFSTCHLLT